MPWPSGKARVCKTLIPRFKSGRHLQQVGLLLALLGACHRRAPAASAARVEPVAPAQARPASGGQALLGPVAGFAATAPVDGVGWTRRRYARAGVTIDVTVAEQPMTAAEYADWERQARDYPSAQLRPAASGFFTCGAGESPHCDLHVQTPGGEHLELSGGGRATRADLEQLYAGLNWGR